MTDCRHVTQFDGSPCTGYNCAAASCAMLVFLGTAGAVAIDARQVRAESGRSCTPMDPPDATHSRSGGLYISDVQAVGRAHGVAIDYNGGASWPAGTLRQRLIAGDAAVILGDCQFAPVNPTAGVVYHSAVVHDYDQVHDTTHWHDPRTGAGVWVPLAQVEAYQLGFGGQRLAGFARDYVSLPAAPKPVSVLEQDLTGWTATVAAGASVYGSASTGDIRIRALASAISVNLAARWSGGFYADELGRFFTAATVFNLAAPAAAPATPIEEPSAAPAPAPEPVPAPPAPEPTTQPDPSSAPPVGGGSVVSPPPADGTPAEAIDPHDRELLEGAGLIQDGRLLTRDQVVEKFSQSPDGE